MSKPRSLLVALAGTLCVFPASAVAKAPERLTLTSAPVRGHAVKGRVLGPFTLRNTTRVAYDVATFPVLLTQSRDGGLSVRDDARARRAAARKLAVPTPRFRLEPGQARSMPAAVVQAPAAQGLYAGILFASRPDTAAPTGGGTQIINVLRLNARVFLAPREARVNLATGALRVEQAPARRLDIKVPVMNHGNILAPVSGHVLVRDAAGKRVDDLPVTPVEILPGATVDVAAQVRRLLQPGRYGLEAILHASGKTLRVRGAMRLFGVNEIRTENAVLSELQPVKAESGHPLKVIAAFRNTGNVRYAPTAQVQLRAVDAQGAGPVLTTKTLNVEVADPGAQGRIGGSVDLPEGQKTIDVTVRLLAGDRELDSQSTRAVVHTPPSLMQRLDEFVRAHAMAIVAALAALLLAMAGLGIGYVRRLKAAARAAA